MAGLTSTELNQAVDTEKARLVAISLHTADPGTTGASEASGGSYARQSLTFGTTSSGAAAANQVSFDVPSGTYTHFGVWDSTTASGSTFRGGGSLSSSETFDAAGTLKVTLTLTGTTS